MLLKYVLKLQQILQCSGCRLEKLTRVLPISYYLQKKIDIKTDGCCNFCKNEIETTIHVFLCVKKVCLFGGISTYICIVQHEKDLVLMVQISF